MGFLSNILMTSKQPSDSYVREWAEQRANELRYSQEVSPEVLFAGMILGLATFARKDPRRKTPRKLKDLGIDAAEHYSGDAALFEVGCYLYFRTDLWFALNEPKLRDELSTTFVREFNLLFTRALEIDNVADIFTERVSKYGEFARNEADLKKYHFYLTELVLRTKDGAPPSTYKFEDEPLLILNAFERFGVQTELLGWEKGMIPALIDCLKRGCSMMEECRKQ